MAWKCSIFHEDALVGLLSGLIKMSAKYHFMASRPYTPGHAVIKIRLVSIAGHGKFPVSHFKRDRN